MATFWCRYSSPIGAYLSSKIRTDAIRKRNMVVGRVEWTARTPARLYADPNNPPDASIVKQAAHAFLEWSL